jgi:hypothetical protein
MNFKKLMNTNKVFKRIVNEEAVRIAKIINTYEKSKTLNEDYTAVRGILNMIFDEDRFINTADVQKNIAATLDINILDKDEFRRALLRFADTNSHDSVFELWKTVRNDLMARNLDMWYPPSSNPYETTGGAPRPLPGGGSWRGD